MEYTLQELIAEWKMRKGLEPLRIDASIKRQDAFEIDEYIRRIIDSRYERLLHEGPLELLELADITGSVSIDSFENGIAVLKLPDDCCRLVEIKMKSWERPALIVNADSKTGRRQVSPFSRGGLCNPIAVREADGFLRLYGFNDTEMPVAERVIAVTRPAEQGIYRCKPLALEYLFS